MSTMELAEALSLAEAAANSGKWQDVQRILGTAREGLDSEPQALYLLAKAHSQVTELESARAVAENALERFRERGDQAGCLKAENLLGIILFEAGELDAARSRFRTALRLAMEAGALNVRADIANNLGTICDLREEHTQALEYFQIALRSYLEIGDLKGQAQTTHNLALLHKALGERQTAQTLFVEAAAFALAAREDMLFAFSVVARAELVIEEGDGDLAEELLRLALPRFTAAANLYGLTEVHRVRGLVARRCGNLVRAREHLDAAADYGAMHGVPLLDAEVRLERGHLLCMLGEKEAGVRDLRSAIETLERLHSTRRAERARALLHTLAAPESATSVRVAS